MMDILPVAGVVSFIMSVWTAVTNLIYRTRFRSDIMDSPYIADERILYYKYAHRIKNEHYAAFAVIPREPQQGFIVRQSLGIHFLTQEMAKSFWKRFGAYFCRSRRPYFQISGLVTDFVVIGSLSEAKRACIERGKYEKKLKKTTLDDTEDTPLPQPMIAVNYRSLKFLFRGSRAVNTETHSSIGIKMTSLSTNRVMNPDHSVDIEIDGEEHETWRDWDIKLAADEGVAWRDRFGKLKWYSATVLYSLTPIDNDKTKNLRIEIGTSPTDMGSPLWTRKKLFASQTFLDSLTAVGISNPASQISQTYGMDIQNKTKKPKNQMVTIGLKAADAVKLNDGTKGLFGFSFVWNGNKPTENDDFLRLFREIENNNIEIVDSETAHYDGIIATKDMQPILERFKIVAEEEYRFAVKTALETRKDR